MDKDKKTPEEIGKYFDRLLDMKPYLDIPAEQWEYIKETYDKEEVKFQLARIAFEYPLPLVDISEKMAYKDYMKLKGIRWNELLKTGEWYPRKAGVEKYPITFDGEFRYFGRSNVGNHSSNYFQQLNRWGIDSSHGAGPITTWASPMHMKSLMGAAYSLKMPCISKSNLRVMIGLRKYIATQFKPSVAKSLYDYFKPETVLDFSMGWGDRLAGFYAGETTKHYIGLDPRTENHEFYNQQREFYDKHRSFFEEEKTSEFHKSPAEDFDFTSYENTVDLIFTSPPYFSVEHYGHDDTQSWIRYKEIDAWNKNFLHKTLGNLIPTLKKGGVMIINISDIKSKTKGTPWMEITNPMNDFLKEKGMTYLGCIGMELAKRPNTLGSGTAKNDKQYTEEEIKEAEKLKDKRFAEPQWIWQKNF